MKMLNLSISLNVCMCIVYAWYKYFEYIKDHTPAIIIKPKEEPKLPTKEEYNSKEEYSRNEEYISNGSCEVLVGKTCSDLSKVYISNFLLIVIPPKEISSFNVKIKFQQYKKKL